MKSLSALIRLPTAGTLRVINKLAKYSILLTLLIHLTACTEEPSKSVKELGVLNVISRNGPTTYYQDRNGQTGFEFELAQLFADYLNVKLNMTSVHSLEEIFTALESEQAHIAAAGLTVTVDREKRFNFSPGYLEIKQYVLYKSDRKKPRSIDDIVNSNIIVVANSSHAEILKRLQHQHPQLSWHGATDVETIDLLDMLMANEIDYAIVDSNEYIANRAFYPKLNIGFEIGQPGKLAWALAGNSKDDEFNTALTEFFEKITNDGTLRQLEERYYSHSEQINKVGSMTFNQAVKKRLPKHLELIKEVANEYGMEWQLLASISYQESHWNPKARSPTGVRGMMMLTLTTAKEMGIKNRLDVEASLRGGARYFNKILQRLPSSIQEPDRTWFALAAYNVGYGHLEDARKITQQNKGNPNIWADVKDNLPLLRKRRWYKNTRYGYARGNEPVVYVQNIRHFYNLLTWTELAKNRTPPPQEVEQYLPSALQTNIKTL